MRVVYFDCFSGAAGDMILGALLDAGAPLDDVKTCISALKVDGWGLEVDRVMRGSLSAAKARVATTDGNGTHRYRDIAALVDRAALSERTKRWASGAFHLLAQAEAGVHGSSIEEVHLHEAGALDAIVDVVGACAALDALGPDRVVCSPVATGRGTTNSDHGPLPLPAPAVAAIAEQRGIPLFGEGTDELITPTGAAILAAVSDEFGPLPQMTVTGTGYGAGDMEREVPNVVRVMVGENEAPDPDEASNDALVIETNLDDMSPELIPHVIDALLGAGAQDAWVTPIMMKKGRPAITLSVLTDPRYRWHIYEILFRETTTLGVRITPVTKEVLEREWIEVDVEGSSVRVKIGKRAEDIVTIAPEHEDASKVARATGLPLKEIYAMAIAEARAVMDLDL